MRRVPNGEACADDCSDGASSSNHTPKQTSPMKSARVHGMPGKVGGFPGAPTTGARWVAAAVFVTLAVSSVSSVSSVGSEGGGVGVLCTDQVRIGSR